VPVVEKPTPTPPPQPSGPAGSVIQLGAYKNAAQAERAWSALSTRFPNVKAMTKLVVPFSGGFRLRAGAASPADAKQVCQALRVAGENCFVRKSNNIQFEIYNGGVLTCVSSSPAHWPMIIL